MRKLAFIAVLLAFIGVALGGVRAGTRIANTAVATYEDDTGYRYTAFSNTIEVAVAPVYGVELTPDFQEKLALPGQKVILPFSLKNTGNSVDRYSLGAEVVSGSVQELSFYIDVNGNGKIEPGEPLYSNASPPNILPGEALPLLLKVELPPELFKESVELSITATSLSNQLKADRSVGVIKVTPGGFVALTKEADRFKVLPGQEVEFGISFSNPGSREVKGVDIPVDLNGDGTPEFKSGVLIEDELPPQVELLEVGSFEPEGLLVYREEGSSYWKTSQPEGRIEAVGLLLPSISPDQQGYLELKVKVKEGLEAQAFTNVAKAKFLAPEGEKEVSSNQVTLRVLEIPKVVVDDVDDGSSYTGSGSPEDSDDLTVISSAVSGQWVEFRNEVWNLGNAPDVIDISWDRSASVNIPDGALVYFFTSEGTPLGDVDGDGISDVGFLEPGSRFEFITKVYLPVGTFENVVIAVRGNSSIDPNASDLTFNKVERAEPVAVQVVTRVQTQVGASFTPQPLRKKRVAVYEVGARAEPLREKVFLTNDEGIILYDEKGREYPLYNWMREGRFYRLALLEEIDGFSYYLTAPFKKEYFDEVTQPGEEKCWTFDGSEVDCASPEARVKVKVQEDGTRLLINSLDPAGYVYDGVTGQKVNGACVRFYKCSDEDCNSYSLVEPSRLDLYPDGATSQENPQVSGPTDGKGNLVKKGEGGFQFSIYNFKAEDVGWYFVTVDFNCSLPASKPELSEKYAPIGLRRDSVWTPTSGKPYTGERFYVDFNFPGAILMRIPLYPASLEPLRVTKTVSSSTATIGDFVKWSIKVENPNRDFTVYSVEVKDLLPRGLRYKGGTTKVDGKPSGEPEIFGGRELLWRVGDIPPGGSVEVTFYTVITPGIKEGKLKNLAYASGWGSPTGQTPVGSNEGFAYLKVGKGVFTDRGYIIGRVFIDENGNGIYDDGEVGVRGVKLYLEDGRFVVTDKRGKYHFDDVRPGTHVVKLDKTTLPPGVELAVTSNRNAGEPGSSFADVFPGDIFKVNFALVPKGVKVKFKGEFAPLSGKVKFERLLKELSVDPSSGEVAVKNILKIENLSPNPIYEVTYTESSPYRPRRGSSYLNGSPIDEPTEREGGFSWRIPIILPNSSAVLSWISDLPKEGGRAEALLKLSLKPTEDEAFSLPVKVPIVIEVIEPKSFRLTVFLKEDGSVDGATKASLKSVAQFLRKQGYREVVIKAYAGEELSFSGGQRVKSLLKELFIEPKAVRVER